MGIIRQRLMSVAEDSVDCVYRYIPRAKVTADEWRRCQLVAHRGCHDAGQTIHENTLEAFEAACQADIWGIEFDIQWTLDGVPVVIHDPDTARLPGVAAVEVGRTGFDELRRFCPLVPRLDEVVERFTGRIHLMVELKSETINSRGIEQVARELSGLKPVEDFHVMSLQAETLRMAHDFPVESRIAIAITNTRDMFNETLNGGIGGFTGHFLLLNSKMREELDARNISWGTGFINSTNLLAREIRSGARWLFSDAAGHLAARLNQLG